MKYDFIWDFTMTPEQDTGNKQQIIINLKYLKVFSSLINLT